MPTPKDLPKELRGLWKHQYEPREKIILSKVSESTKKKWKKLRYIRKIEIIDDFHREGII